MMKKIDHAPQLKQTAKGVSVRATCKFRMRVIDQCLKRALGRVILTIAKNSLRAIKMAKTHSFTH